MTTWKASGRPDALAAYIQALCRLPGGIRARREQRGLTIAHVAERLGVSRRTVERWESGANTPDLDACRQLARILK